MYCSAKQITQCYTKGTLHLQLIKISSSTTISFLVTISSRFITPDHYKPFLISEATGCISTKHGHYLAFDMEKTGGSYISEIPLTWKETRNCTPENYVQVLENGVIKALMTNQCIAVTNLSEDNEGTKCYLYLPLDILSWFLYHSLTLFGILSQDVFSSRLHLRFSHNFSCYLFYGYLLSLCVIVINF